MDLGMVIDYIENHPVLVSVLGTIVAAVVAGIIGKKNKGRLVSARRDVSVQGDVVSGDQTKITSVVTKDETRDLGRFAASLARGPWISRVVSGGETWFLEEDRSYQIRVGSEGEEFREPWTEVYPDKYGSLQYEVHLLIDGVVIEELKFISCDGGRIFVPRPEIKMRGSERVFYWDRDSVEFRVGEIIGRFYRYGTLEGVAEKSRIEIVG
jgi:hypothetical protein